MALRMRIREAARFVQRFGPDAERQARARPAEVRRIMAAWRGEEIEPEPSDSEPKPMDTDWQWLMDKIVNPNPAPTSQR